MFYVIINILLFLSLLLLYKKKRKGIDIYQIIVFMYLITAVLCAVNYSQQPNRWPDLGLIPFLYMFFVLLIMFQPLKRFNLEGKNVILTENSFIYLLGFVYIAIGIFDIATSLSSMIERFYSGEWLIVRNQLYDDAESVVYYDNQLQRFAKNFLTYTKPFAMVYSFYLLTKPKINIIYTLSLFVAYLLTSFIGASVVASRGLIFQLAVSTALTYFLFRKKIPQKRRKYIAIGASIVGVVFLSYSILVSISRFGEDDAGNSIFDYFGHSMLYFNDGLFNKMHDFAYGKRFFSFFIDLFGGDSSFDFAKAGSTHGTSFYTIVGDLFSDGGIIGGILMALIACAIMMNFFRKRTLFFSDMIIILFYLNTLSAGIFALGKGRALNWFMTFVLYFIIRIIESKQKTSTI